MAKKSFKKDIDSLIQESGIEIENQEQKNQEQEPQNETISDEKVYFLQMKIEKLSTELRKWRTGKLSVQKFHESLAKFNLKYNPTTNDFEKINP